MPSPARSGDATTLPLDRFFTMWNLWRQPAKSTWRRGFRASTMLHACAAGWVIGELLGIVPELVAPPAGNTHETIELTASTSEPPHAVAEMTFGNDDAAWIRQHAFELGEIAELASDERLGKLAETLGDEPPPASDSGEGNLISESLMRAIRESEQRSAEENLERLEDLTGTLNAVSDQESVDQLVQGFQKWMGTKPRATKPAEEPDAGEFDPDSAQLHDVTMATADDGTVTYKMVLVDSAGRQFETDLSAEEGEQLHRVFALIKENPLLERIYRGVVMSLMDKMLETKK